MINDLDLTQAILEINKIRCHMVASELIPVFAR